MVLPPSPSMMVLMMRSPTLSIRAAAAALLALVLTLSAATAQPLQQLLPASTVAAFGVSGLAASDGLQQAFVEPWERLGLGQALLEVFGELDTSEFIDGEALDEELPDLDPWALLGEEAWLGVSLSPFNPLPAVVFLARIDGDTDAAIADWLADQPERTTLSEGAIDFDQLASGSEVIAVARFGGVLAVSNNPDELRAALRQAQGSSEASFTDQAAYQATLGQLGLDQQGSSGYATYLDLGAVVERLLPLAAGMGFDASLNRVQALFSTLGPVGTVGLVDENGLVSSSLRRLDPAGGDAALLQLFEQGAGEPAPRSLLGWLPEGTLSVYVSAIDPAAVWRYLGLLVRDLPEVGIPDLDGIITGMLGVQVGADLFSWTAPGFMSVTTGGGQAAPIGAPADDLLGETVYLLRTRDAAAAEAGLSRLLRAATERVSLFADPFAAPGASAPVNVRQSQVGSVTVNAYDVLPGLTLATAVSGDVVFISTTEDGLAQVLATGGVAPLPSVFEPLLGQVPGDASAFSLSDDRASLLSTSELLAQQVQLLAGFGPGDLDFDAVERLTALLQDYIEAIAPLFGGSVGWTTSAGGGGAPLLVYSDGITRIDLR